jgi:hypothetical protein
MNFSNIFSFFNKPQPTQIGTKIKCLEIRAEPGFISTLDSLAERSDATRAEVIDMAIRLYAIALKEAEEGKTIKFVFPDSHLTEST